MVGGVKRDYEKVQLCNRETDLPQNARKEEEPLEAEPLQLEAEPLQRSAAIVTTSNAGLDSACSEGVVPTILNILNKLKKEHDIAKAVKSDDAEVPVHLWDYAVMRGEPLEAESRH